MKKIKKNNLVIKYKVLLNLILISFSNNLYATENESKKIKFNTSLLTDFNKNIDVSWLENDNIPDVFGKQDVDILLNGKKMGLFSIQFINNKDGVVKPCIPIKILRKVNLNQEAFEKIKSESCIIVEDVLPGARSHYEYDDENVEITLPQIYLKETPEGYVDPALWEDGINALTTNYTLSASNFFQRQNKRDSAYYGNVFSILRFKQWRFFSYDTFSGGNQRENRINHLQTYAKRPIRSLRAELSLGDFSSTGERFPSTALRGVALQTDERMFPWTQKGYAPTINGIANSNAVVTISQNGNTLYERSVPPGEFRINDLYALGYGGDLTVQVKESDGKVNIYTVPYSNLPQLLRKGFYKYSLVSGRLANKEIEGSTIVNEATISYGVSNQATIFGGVQYVTDNTYKAVNSGVAFNTPLGAISGEMTQSWSDKIEEKSDGNSFKDRTLFKISLAKVFNDTKTNFNIASYYLSGKNYYNLNDAIYKRKLLYKDESWDVDRYRNRFEVVLSQQLTDSLGSFSLSYLREKGNYSGKNNDKKNSYLIGYRNSYNSLSYSVGINKAFTSNGYNETQYYLNLSMPFGFKATPRPSLNMGLSYNSDNSTVRTSINGTVQHESSTSSLSSYFSQSSKYGPDFGFSIGNTDSYLQKNINYSQGKQSNSLGANLSGGILIHSDAIQFSSYLPDTLALIEAKGAEGAKISGNTHSKIDYRGYGISGGITPYQENIIFLQTEGSNLSFDSNEDSQLAIPTASSIVKKTFSNKNEKTLVVKVKGKDDKWLPFGTNIYSEGKLVGTLSQGGLALISLDHGIGNLKVKGIRNGHKFECDLLMDKISIEKLNAVSGYSFNLLTCE